MVFQERTLRAKKRSGGTALKVPQGLDRFTFWCAPPAPPLDTIEHNATKFNKQQNKNGCPSFLLSFSPFFRSLWCCWLPSPCFHLFILSLSLPPSLSMSSRQLGCAADSNLHTRFPDKEIEGDPRLPDWIRTLAQVGLSPALVWLF